MNVSDFLLHRLHQWGVRRIYGYPGDGVNGLMRALDRAGDQFKLLRARHEEMCAFMACAHAKDRGKSWLGCWHGGGRRGARGAGLV